MWDVSRGQIVHLCGWSEGGVAVRKRSGPVFREGTEGSSEGVSALFSKQRELPRAFGVVEQNWVSGRTIY